MEFISGYSKLRETVKGYKTYFVALLLGLRAVLFAFGMDMPDWIFPMLTAFGLGFLRAGYKTSLGELKDS